jgi:hypothetical protein
MSTKIMDLPINIFFILLKCFGSLPYLYWAQIFYFVFLAGSYGENVRRQSHTPSAIVIGGGFAGLAAADALRNASFQVLFSVIHFMPCTMFVVQWSDLSYDAFQMLSISGYSSGIP